jgi:short-subunit dehydrogenase
LTKLFAHDGYDLVLVARSEQQLQQLADELHNKFGITVRVIAKDLSAAGKTVVIPGIRNKLLVETVRFSPRNMATQVVRNMQERSH